jgi:serine/threonine protein kinase/Ni/Co efflux regulator RcnB
VPRRPERGTDPALPDPATVTSDWLNLHQSVQPPSKPAEPLPEKKKNPSGSFVALGPLITQPTDTASATSLLPKMVGPYEIIKELGRGGMGVVYLAKDSRLKRPVALKMILSGAYADRDQRERFHAEAQAVAQLKHPNIVQIYEIGDYEGHPYLALEYFDGGNMRQVCMGQPQDHRWAAQVVKTLAEAMEYAHNRGVVHRDLKPANILLQKDDDNTKNRKLRWGQRFPASSYVRHSSVKITDFGLAKFITETEQATEPEWKVYEYSGEAIGTPQYMAPEQAQGEPNKGGAAADIYSLGAILYDLLTGRPPFDGPTPRDTILRVLTEEVLPPSRLQPKLPRDLETICLKCLQKEPSKRYASAADLVADLRCYLTGEPIRARRTIFIQKGIKWAKRRPRVASLMFCLVLLALVALGIIGGAMFDLSLALNAERSERHRLEEQYRQLKASDGGAQILLDRERDAKRLAERKLYALLFAAAMNKEDAQRVEPLHRFEKGQEFTEDYRGWECYFAALPERSRQATYLPLKETGTIASVAIPQGEQPTLAVIAPSGKAVRCVEAGLTRKEFPLGEDISNAALSPDGQSLAATTWNEATHQGRLLVWSLKEDKPPQSWRLTHRPRQIAFDAESRRLALSCAETGAALGKESCLGRVDLLSGKVVWSEKFVLADYPALAIARQGRQVFAAGNLAGEVIVWEPDAALSHVLRYGNSTVVALQCSPCYQRLVLVDTTGKVQLFDAVTGLPLLTLKEQLALPADNRAAVRIAFSPNGCCLAVLQDNQTLLRWSCGRSFAPGEK